MSQETTLPQTELMMENPVQRNTLNRNTGSAESGILPAAYMMLPCGAPLELHSYKCNRIHAWSKAKSLPDP